MINPMIYAVVLGKLQGQGGVLGETKRRSRREQVARSEGRIAPLLGSDRRNRRGKGGRSK